MATPGSSPVLSTPFVKSTHASSGRYRCVRLYRPMAVSADQSSSPARVTTQNGRLLDSKKKKRKETNEFVSNIYSNPDEIPDEKGETLIDYLEVCKGLMIESKTGPPRWFTPLEGGSHASDSPLLLFLPGSISISVQSFRKMMDVGIDGMGLGLIKHHRKLGKNGKVRVQEITKPTNYIVGESLGACIALDVAARNPDVDLMLILANPATSFSQSQLQSLIPLLQFMPSQLLPHLPYMMNLASGDPLRMVLENMVKGLMPHQTIGELTRDLVAISSYLTVLADILPGEALVWKLQMLKSASATANSHLHAVKAQALLLCSGKDKLFPSQEEAQRLYRRLPKCEIRTFEESGHFLFLEEDFDLVTTIKGASFYRRGKYLDYVSDYMPPTPYEFKKIYESQRTILSVTSPVLLSTLEDGKVVRGLAGIPSEGPVLLVGYHMLLGFELAPLVFRFMMERNILLRGIAHPMMFNRLKEGKMPDLASFDIYRLMGSVPVSGPNFYKLLSSKSHVLLYPGGVREALHRKGEEYKLFWPEQSEFVRMASRFEAKIVPFGVVGEDDIGEFSITTTDANSSLRTFIKELSEEVERLRYHDFSETYLAFEVFHNCYSFSFWYPYKLGMVGLMQTVRMKNELRSREKSQELYLHVKSEVENCIAYLKEKREEDPYRNLLPRLLYQATHGFTDEVPTFEI
ncbi:putative Esterase/lipase/thioesterase family protein [Hibiscus syriacus]|uniref:Esterase/lipase/thioesterase family protein n=1 Tax=Hibiscus syriacus TaxID=106335 RepID=A0A6A3AR84_HIBSY|nr:putative Esterase/lipase/thioesterase family protein [Hibiscus syriacus]